MDDSQNITPDPELQIQTDEVDSTDPEEGEALSSSVAHFLQACWVKRRMFFAICFVGILISVLYALALPNMYTSTTSLMPSSGSSPRSSILNALSSSSAAAYLGGEVSGYPNPKLFITILESRNVQDGLIGRLDLIRYYRAADIEEARRSLEAATKIKLDEDTGVITITVTAENPVFAANVARNYVDELNRVVTDNTTSAARRERIFLEGRVRDTKQQLDESAKELSQFSAKSGTIDVSSQAKSMVDEGLKLQAELIDGRSILAALRQTYSEDNVRVRAQEAHNAELQRQLEEMRGSTQRSTASVNTDKPTYPTAEELPKLGLTYYDLERRLTVEESLWEALTREYESAKVEEAAETPSVQVLDPANVPAGKSSPVRRFIVELGALISLVLACVVVFLGMVWEGVTQEDELKKLMTSSVDTMLDSQRWYWRLPGLSWLRRYMARSA